jgi:outer membrane immunogenic protein
MKDLCVVAVVSIASALSINAHALAADLPERLTYKAPVVGPVWDWTGTYLGGGVGAKWADTTWTTTSIVYPFFAAVVDRSSPRDYDSSGLRLGGYFGYNWQFAPQWVAGVEADWAYANKKVATAGIPGCSIVCIVGFPGPGVDVSSVKMGWDASARVRLGFLLTPNLLAYGTGGIAWQHFEASATCQHTLPDPICVVLPGSPFASVTNKVTRTGWTIGGGLEARISGNWLLRGEYRYSDFGTKDNSFNLGLPGATTIVNSQLKITTQIATLGIAYKFGP